MNWMPSFGNPWLLMLLIIPALLVFAPLRVGRPVPMPFDHRSHRTQPLLTTLLAVLSLLPPLVLALAIIALARPQRLNEPKALRALTNIEVVLDVSGSMMSEGRYLRAAEAIREFTLAREGDAMGLTLFGDSQIRWVPLTKDLQAVRNALPFADPEHQPYRMGGTAIGAALRYVVKNMETDSQEGDRMVILVSDGMSPDAQNGEQYKLADELAAAHCVVYYVHVARDDPICPEVAELAKITGGEGFAASDKNALSMVFSHIDRMVPARFIPQASVPLDDVGWLGAAAFALFSLHSLALLGLRYTPW